MPDDPYTILGVARDASADDIRSAYRTLAKQHHPDLNPGNKASEERFKAIAVAYDLVGDAEKRARFDRGEIDAAGQERAPQHGAGGYRTYAETAQGDRYGGGWPREDAQGQDWHPEDLEDLFGDMFAGGGRPGGGRAGAGGGRGTAPRRGRDALYGLTVDFLDAVNGAAKRLTLPDGRTLDVKVPPGMQDGRTMRLRGQGGPGRNGGPAGDALIEIHVLPHKFFRREGQDIRLDLPVTVKEAVLGGPVLVPTPGGRLRVSIPADSDTGKELRLRGRGVPAHGGQAAGDLYVTLRVVVGATDAALQDFLRGWQEPEGSDPRRAMEEGA